MDIPTEIPIPPKENKRKPFWARQFAPRITNAQGAFDVIVGAIIPILLLIFDPTVFRAGVLCVAARPVLGQYTVFAYLAIGFGVLVLLIWLFVRPSNPVIAGSIAGVMTIGTIFALMTGVVLLPASIPGLLVFCIGSLGFFPFLTAFVYLRNTIRAFRVAFGRSPNVAPPLFGFLVGMMLVLIVPALAQTHVTNVIQQSVSKIVENPSAPDPKAIADLQALNTLCLQQCTSQIAVAFDQTFANSTDRYALDTLYKKITGQSLFAATCSSSAANSSSE